MARTIRLESSGGDAPRRALSEIAGFLSVPARLQAQQQQTEIDRAVLQRLGMAPEEIGRLAPPPPIQLPQTGIAGRALSGIGQVGSLLSTALGTPVEAPRPPLGTLLAIEQIRPGQEEMQLRQEAAELIQDPEALEDEANLRKFTGLMLRTGESQIAGHLLGFGKTSKGESLSTVLSRMATRATGSPPGTPEHDSELYAYHMGLRYDEAKHRGLGENSPEVVNARVRRVTAESAASRGAQQLVEAKTEYETMKGLLDLVQPAVKRQIRATTLWGRTVQAGRAWAVMDYPWLAENLFGVQPDPTNQREDDLQLIDMLNIVGRKLLTGARLDSASKMSDKDVEQLATSLPKLTDAAPRGNAKVRMWLAFLEKVKPLSYEEFIKQFDSLLSPMVEQARRIADGDDFEQIMQEARDERETTERVEGGDVDRLLDVFEKNYGRPGTAP